MRLIYDMSGQSYTAYWTHFVIFADFCLTPHPNLVPQQPPRTWFRAEVQKTQQMPYFIFLVGFKLDLYLGSQEPQNSHQLSSGPDQLLVSYHFDQVLQQKIEDLLLGCPVKHVDVYN
jgi:hypothetical protein